MRFELTQHLACSPTAAAAAYADPDLYPRLAELPVLGSPVVLDHAVDGDIVRLQVRHHFAGELSAAARAVLDPARLTWVEHATHDLAARRVDYELIADHYRDRFRSSGHYRFEEAPGGAVRLARGEVHVKVRLVGGAVERALVSGLRDHLDEEAALVERFVAERG